MRVGAFGVFLTLSPESPTPNLHIPIRIRGTLDFV